MSDIAFVRGDKEKNFTILDNTCIRDETLTWGAKGLHCYLQHLPGDWKIYKSYLISHYPDKRVALNNLINELVKAGYIEVEKNLRNPDGTFAPQRYIVFEKPQNNQCRLSTADNTTADNPLSENQHLLTTNKLNTNILKTELTNCANSNGKPEDISGLNKEKKVSESVFEKSIKNLFEGEYPFDKNFETDVFQHLSDTGIEETYIEAYLNYVYERTKLGNVKKSFEGLYRKLALSSSIVRDFKNSSYMRKTEGAKKGEYKSKYVVCPICSTRFVELENYCPTCSVSIQEINKPTKPSFIVKKRYYEMTDSEKQKYDISYSEWEEKIKTQNRRPFITENEKVQFWKEYGLIG